MIKPLLEQNVTVILDRFSLSSVAYQGYGRGVDINFINNVNNFVTLNVKPDAFFLIDLDPETALARVKGGFDRIEQTGTQFFDKIRKGYLAESEIQPDLIHLINGDDTKESIFRQVKEKLKIYF